MEKMFVTSYREHCEGRKGKLLVYFHYDGLIDHVELYFVSVWHLSSEVCFFRLDCISESR